MLLKVKGAEKGVTPIGRYIHSETPCATCVPLYLMPVNIEAYGVFTMCRNAVLRNPVDGAPIDIDIKALSSTVLAIGGEKDVLFSVVNLMRHLIYEELI